MDIETLKTLSLICYLLAALFTILAIALYFILKVPKLIGDVTGRTAKKAIENIRQQNAESGNKAYKTSPVNSQRGKLTDKISPSGQLLKSYSNNGGSVGTEKLDIEDTSSNMYETVQETTILNTSQETTILNNSDETTVLYENSETTVLSPNEFIIEVDIGFNESNEIIE